MEAFGTRLMTKGKWAKQTTDANGSIEAAIPQELAAKKHTKVSIIDRCTKERKVQTNEHTGKR